MQGLTVAQEQKKCKVKLWGWVKGNKVNKMSNHRGHTPKTAERPMEPSPGNPSASGTEDKESKLLLQHSGVAEISQIRVFIMRSDHPQAAVTQHAFAEGRIPPVCHSERKKGSRHSRSATGLGRPFLRIILESKWEEGNSSLLGISEVFHIY